MQLRRGDYLSIDPARGLVAKVQTGLMARTVDRSDSTQVFVQYFLPGDVVGLDVVHSRGSEMVTYRALTDCDVLEHQKVPEAEVVPMLARLCTRMIEVTELMVRPTVKERLCGFLLWASMTPLAFKDSGVLKIKLTHQDLAECTSTTRENLTKVMGEIQRLGAVAITYGAVELLDLMVLEDLYHSTPVQL